MGRGGTGIMRWIMRHLVALTLLFTVACAAGRQPPEGGMRLSEHPNPSEQPPTQPPPQRPKAEKAGQLVFLEAEPTFAVPFREGKDLKLIMQSKGGPYKCVSIAVLSVKDEAGSIISSDSVTATADKCKNIKAEASEEFSVKVDPSHLQRPGRYKVNLLIKQNNKVVDTKTVVLIRDEPELESLPPLKVFVERPYPIRSEGTKQHDIVIREVSGRGGVDDVKVAVDPLIGSDKATLFPGTIRPEFVGSDGHQKTNIDPNDASTIHMRISGLTQTGELTTKAIISSPSLKKPFPIPLTIVVRDHWLWALATIGAGIILAFLPVYWTDKKKPRYRLENRIGKLVSDIRKCLAEGPPSVAVDEFLKQMEDNLWKVLEQFDASNRQPTDLENAWHGFYNEENQFDYFLQGQFPGLNPRPQPDWFKRFIWWFKKCFNRGVIKICFWRWVWWGDVSIMLVAGMVATLTGFLQMYPGKPFGGVDYIYALLWGFGVDAGLKGFTPILTKLRSGATP